MLTDRKSIEDRVSDLKSKSPQNKQRSSHSTNQFIYLFGCFTRLKENRKDLDSCGGLAEYCLNLISNILRTLITVLDEEVVGGNNNEMCCLMSVKFVTFLKLTYLEDTVTADEQALVEEFYDLFMKQFEKSEAEWSRVDNQPSTSLLDDDVEVKFFKHVLEYINRNIVDVAKCEDFSADYVKYIKFVCLLGRSKLMKYLLISNSFLGDEVNF